MTENTLIISPTTLVSEQFRFYYYNAAHVQRRMGQFCFFYIVFDLYRDNTIPLKIYKQMA